MLDGKMKIVEVDDCSGQFLTLSRSWHVSIQPQTSTRHMAASRTSEQGSLFYSNYERFR